MSTVQVTKNRAYALYLHQKQVLWKAVSKKYFSIAKDPIYISIFQNLYTLGLFKYHILQYLDKFIIYDFFLLQSSGLYGKPPDKNSSNRHLSWMMLSSIKFRKKYWNHLLTILLIANLLKKFFRVTIGCWA